MQIKIQNLSYIYNEGTPYEYKALNDVNLEIEEGKITAIIGETGSGKSTLVQHLNALLLPKEGSIHILDRNITSKEKPKNLKSLRGDVGLVFQFPEYQLFEETVIKDVAFGPKNFNISEEEANKRAREALKLVGLKEEIYEKSPLELSGGQKRRVAIAGVLAMNPKLLVLDEPTAGLDPDGTTKMMQLFKDLNTKHNKSIIIVTHDMEQVFKYCDDVVIMAEGTVKKHISTREFFKDSSLCKEMNILPPDIIRVKDMLKEKGFNIDIKENTIEALSEAIIKEVKHG